MTENINTYSFNFRREVRAFRSKLDPADDNILFLKGEVANNAFTVSQKIGRNYTATLIAQRSTILDAALRYSKEVHAGGNDASHAVKFQPHKEWHAEDPQVTGRVVFFNKDDFFSGIFGKENKSLMNLFCLYHEAGHTLMRNALTADKSRPIGESIADAYAAICFFQRFGQQAAPFLSMMSWMRASAAFSGGTDHLTTTVLDKIIADSKHIDFSKLTPKETMARAEAYAVEWAPTADMLSELKTINTWDISEKIYLVSDTCLSSGNDFSFYIGAKFFQPFLQPDGIVVENAPITLPAGLRRDIAFVINNRVTGKSLYDIFNRQAPRKREPRLHTLLKVTNNRPQKSLSVRL